MTAAVRSDTRGGFFFFFFNMRRSQARSGGCASHPLAVFKFMPSRSASGMILPCGGVPGHPDDGCPSCSPPWFFVKNYSSFIKNHSPNWQNLRTFVLSSKDSRQCRGATCERRIDGVQGNLTLRVSRKAPSFTCRSSNFLFGLMRILLFN